MRKIYFAAWAAAGLAVGCAGSNSAGLPGMAANGQPGAAGHPIADEATWTQRMTASFKGSLASIGLAGEARGKRTPMEPVVPFEPGKESPELYVGMAQMSHRSGNVDQARQFYQKALAIEPKHLEALLGAARMEDREGRLDVALMLYQRAAAAHPRSATALNDLALCHARQGNLPSAHQALEQAIRLEPRKALYRNNVAKVLVELNQLDAAASHLVAVLPPAAAHYNMGVLLSQRGRDGESGQYLSKAVALDPQMEPARAMLAQMKMSPANIIGNQQVIAQTTTAPTVSPESNDSILPTPEVVATIPWKPQISVDAIVQPRAAAAPPAGADSAAGNPVLVLPQVN